jgi:hypothetical protein
MKEKIWEVPDRTLQHYYKQEELVKQAAELLRGIREGRTDLWLKCDAWLKKAGL